MPKAQILNKYKEEKIIKFILKEIPKINGIYSLNIKRNIILKRFVTEDSTKFTGIKITNFDQGIQIELHILIYYGSNIPQLCYEIQQRVKEFIESEIEVKILSIDITVDGVISE